LVLEFIEHAQNVNYDINDYGSLTEFHTVRSTVTTAYKRVISSHSSPVVD
jgi:hypothetical protein